MRTINLENDEEFVKLLHLKPQAMDELQTKCVFAALGHDCGRFEAQEMFSWTFSQDILKGHFTF